MKTFNELLESRSKKDDFYKIWDGIINTAVQEYIKRLIEMLASEIPDKYDLKFISCGYLIANSNGEYRISGHNYEFQKISLTDTIISSLGDLRMIYECKGNEFFLLIYSNGRLKIESTDDDFKRIIWAQTVDNTQDIIDALQNALDLGWSEQHENLRGKRTSKNTGIA